MKRSRRSKSICRGGLRDNSAMYDRMENAPCGFVEFTDEGTLLYANRTLAGWLGTEPDAMIGRKFESLLTVANRVFYHTHFLPILKLHGKAEEIFLSLLGADNSRIPVVVCA